MIYFKRRVFQGQYDRWSRTAFSWKWWFYVHMIVPWYVAHFSSTVLASVTSTHWCCVTHLPFVRGLYVLTVGCWWLEGVRVGAGVHRMVLWVLLSMGGEWL